MKQMPGLDFLAAAEAVRGNTAGQVSINATGTAALSWCRQCRTARLSLRSAATLLQSERHRSARAT